MEPISPYKPPSSGIRIGGSEISFKQVIVALLLSFCVAHSGYAIYGSYMEPCESEHIHDKIFYTSPGYVETKEQHDEWLEIEKINAQARYMQAEADKKIADEGQKTTTIVTHIPESMQQSINVLLDKAAKGDIAIEKVNELILSFHPKQS